MFEFHDTEKQIAFLRGLQTKENEEMIEEMIHDLEYPLEKASYNEAYYQLYEARGEEPSLEQVLKLADKMYEELSWPDPESSWAMTRDFLEEKSMDMEPEKREERTMQLQAYFLRAGDLEETYHRLCALEEALYLEKYGEEPEPHAMLRTDIGRQLLGNRPIYELYPEADARGMFEGAYDDLKWRERYYFGTAIPGGHDWERTLNESEPEYKRYRTNLYQQTISALCDAYGEELFFHLPAKEQEQIGKAYSYPAFQAGKWKCVLIPPGSPYGRLQCLTNEGETLVEFYDCGVSKETFPAGQFVSRYYLETLCTNDFGSSLREMAGQGTSFCLDGGIPSWRIEGMELTEIANWLERQYQKEQSEIKRVPVFEEAKPKERTAHSAETLERTSSAPLNQEKTEALRTR